MRNSPPRLRRIVLLLPFLLPGVLTACQPSGNVSATEIAARITAVPVSYSGGIGAFDNGLMVETPFLEIYRGMEGDRWLGRPITRPFDDTDLGWRLQVFEFGVLAQDPSDGRVFLARVGELLGRRQTGVADTGAAGCQYSNRTGHHLCYQFLDYVRAAGEVHFGQPISEMTMGADGLLFQDFEYARLLWYGGGMERERTGETFFAQRGYDLRLREPAVGSAGPAAGQIQLYASLSRPTLQPGETQTLRAVLVDSTGAGIPGVTLQAVVQKEGKELLEIALPATDGAGMASLTFRVPEAEPGTRIRVTVRGMWETRPLEAVAEFEVWW
jgi:hypothetical protein